VLDLTDERAIYGAKLLADLNADVIRVEAPGGDPLRRRGPFTNDDAENGTSLWHALYASNRRFVTVDPTEQRGRRLLEELIGWADIVIDCGWLADASFDADSLVEADSSLVVVRVTSFGPDGPWAELLAPELVAAALGGFASTTGDIDTPPLTGFGDLNYATSGSYTAIAALTALRHLGESGEGQLVDVPVHSVIASCLEHVLMFYWHQEGRVLTRQGSLHWSSAYEVMAARGGHIMVTPTPDMQRNIAWLVEEDVHEDLLDEHYYADPENMLLVLVPRLMQVLRNWVATKDAEDFFFESQARHHPYGLVLTPDTVASNPQLDAREWWAGYEVDGTEVRGPGAPYRFLDTPWALRRAHSSAGSDGDDVLAEIGWAE
jgi:benzylsuccinate CoA-transferase BbsE subunit/naphthyl-2-methylsuccinate CoA transferase subunit